MNEYAITMLRRLEAKINTIARAMAYVVSINVGFAVYALSGDDTHAFYYAISVAIVAGFFFERTMRNSEKLFPDDSPSDH